MPSSPLVRLPAELLLQIFSFGKSIDQLCLALTCRRLLQISSIRPIKIPSVAIHRNLPPPQRSRVDLTLLRRLVPLDAQGQRKRTLALCCDCLKYRSTDDSYWEKDGERYVFQKPWEGSWKSWDNIVARWTRGTSFQCPACWLEEKSTYTKCYRHV